jgi:hypothetical protein
LLLAFSSLIAIFSSPLSSTYCSKHVSTLHLQGEHQPETQTHKHSGISSAMSSSDR